MGTKFIEENGGPDLCERPDDIFHHHRFRVDICNCLSSEKLLEKNRWQMKSDEVKPLQVTQSVDSFDASSGQNVLPQSKCFISMSTCAIKIPFYSTFLLRSCTICSCSVMWPDTRLYLRQSSRVPVSVAVGNNQQTNGQVSTDRFMQDPLNTARDIQVVTPVSRCLTCLMTDVVFSPLHYET